jgi:hypothetical protein
MEEKLMAQIAKIEWQSKNINRSTTKPKHGITIYSYVDQNLPEASFDVKQHTANITVKAAKEVIEALTKFIEEAKEYFPNLCDCCGRFDSDGS